MLVLWGILENVGFKSILLPGVLAVLEGLPVQQIPPTGRIHPEIWKDLRQNFNLGGRVTNIFRLCSEFEIGEKS